MDKKIIVLFLILGIMLSGCKIAEKQIEEPIKTEEQETQEPVAESEQVGTETTEEQVEEETEEINATEPEEGILKIEIDHLTLSQKDVTIEKGTTIRWENKESNKHKLTIYGLVQSPILYQGDSFEYTFEDEGKYTYICAIFKKQIRGTVTVE